jgi:threonylcarbamoyladenosine tRNA methylthiotransferase MtaB
MRTVAFKTFGCRLNHAETAQFEAEFSAAGFARVPFGTAADVVVVHSCAVTQAAENEGVHLLRALRKHGPETCLVLTGCTVEACEAEALRELRLDLVVPHDKKDRLVALVMEHLGLPYSATSPIPPSRSTKRAVLKVQDGCDFFCAYCIVPHARGAPRSRPFEACLADARALIAAGFNEIVVTGCNTACYQDGARSLIDLLDALLALPDLGRIRLGSIEPGTVERDVVALMARSPKLCRFLHLPVQSGDNRVLARMGRRYTVESVSETLREALRLMPDIGLGADVICGFPGETEEAFEHTRAFLQTFPISKLHVFPYSERPGTPAASFDGSVPMAERKQRTQLLIEQGTMNKQAFALRFVNRRVEFLAEHFDRDGDARGWSGEYLACAARAVPQKRLRSLCVFIPDQATDGLLRGTVEPR